jgi:hypothetical protein
MLEFEGVAALGGDGLEDLLCGRDDFRTDPVAR